MKKRVLLYFVLVIILLLTLFSVRRRWTQDRGMRPGVAVVGTNHITTIPKTNYNVASQANPANLPSVPPKAAVATKVSPGEVTRQFVESKNKPIDFYGLVMDQNSNVVPDVHVKVAVQQLTAPNPATLELGANEITLERDTGMDGRFEINGVSGEGFQVESIQKEGYILSPRTPDHFGPGSGSVENPVVIKMWKQGAKASLIGGSYVFGIDSGKTYTLNLVTGNKNEGETEGDLLVSITRPPDAKPRDVFPWSFSIKAIDGGLVEADPHDEFTYVAPDSGYKAKIEMQFDPNSPGWTSVVRENVFIRSRHGQIYGHAQIEIDSIYNVHSAIQIDYTLNHNASRNLQP